jgi:predicted PurR-regulated permease PerM
VDTQSVIAICLVILTTIAIFLAAILVVIFSQIYNITRKINLTANKVENFATSLRPLEWFDIKDFVVKSIKSYRRK